MADRKAPWLLEGLEILGRKLELPAAVSATICEAVGEGPSCCEVSDKSQASVE